MRFRKILALMMALIMAFSLMPMTAFAEEWQEAEMPTGEYAAEAPAKEFAAQPDDGTALPEGTGEYIEEAAPDVSPDGADANDEETRAESPDAAQELSQPESEEAVGAEDETPCLWVGDLEIAVNSQTDIFGDGTAVYDGTTHTLTLTDADISGGTNDHDGAIYTEYMDLNVVYHGDNMLYASYYTGIMVMHGSVAITGDGTLTIRGIYVGGKADHGITAWEGSIAIGGTGILDAKGLQPVIWSEENGLTIADNLAITTPANGTISYSGDQIDDPYSSRWAEEVVIRPRPAYTVTIEAAENGRVIASSSPANAGETITVATQPNPNYELKALAVRETQSGAEVEVSDYAFTMPEADVMITAVFGPKALYDLEADVYDGVSASFFVDGQEVDQAAEGDTVQAVFTTDECYEVRYLMPKFHTRYDNYMSFDRFSNYYPSEENPYYEVDYESDTVTFTMPHTDVMVYVECNQLYRVDSSTAEHATVVSDRKWYYYDDTVYLEATPERGYKIDTLTVKDDRGREVDVTLEEDGTYSFQMPGGGAFVYTECSVNIKFPDMRFCESSWIKSVGGLGRIGQSSGTATMSVRDGKFVLTLDNFHYTGSGHNEGYQFLLYYYAYGSEELVIELIGENVLTQTGSYGTSYGICSDKGNVTIEGDGSLSITAADASDSFIGISGSGISIKDATVNVTAGSTGINGSGISIKDATVNVEAGGTGISGSGVSIENATVNVEAGGTGINANWGTMKDATVNVTAGGTGINCNDLFLNYCELTSQGDDKGLTGRTSFSVPATIYAGDTAPGEHISRSNIGNGHKYIRVTFSDDTYMLHGSGTEDDPYLIKNLDDWGILADYYSGAYSDASYTGKYFKMSDDFDNSDSPTDVVVGCYNCRFDGIFDGNGRTLTIATANGNTAPFAQIEGAVIKNLTVDGSIVYQGSWFGGLATYAWGNNRISNCIVTVDLTSPRYISAAAGGFVGKVWNGEMVIEDSAFYGSLLGEEASSSAGFVGATETGDGALVRLDNVFFAPERITMLENGSCTFARSNDLSMSPILSRAYYTQSFGTVQGTKVMESLPENGICEIVSAPGGRVFYLPTVSVTLGSEDWLDPSIMDALTYALTDEEGETLVEGTDYEASFTRTDTSEGTEYTLVITGIGRYAGTYERHFKIINGSGTEQEPFVISNADQWNAVARAYPDGDLSGKYFKLSDDFDNSAEPVTGMIGTDECRFDGHFDGNGRTLTLGISGAGNVAPFAYAEDAEIHDLTVDGSVATSNAYAGGIAANIYGSTVISDCVVLADITGTVSYAYMGGFVGIVHDGSVTICNSYFSGSLLGGMANSCGGFIGRILQGAEVTMDNVLFAPSSITVSSSQGATFARDDNGCTLTIENAYYTNALGKKQGVLVLAEQPDADLYRTVTAADGGTYYITADVTGIASLYFAEDEENAPRASVTDSDGTVLSEGLDYTVSFVPENLAEGGVFEVVVDGIGDYAGTWKTSIRVLGGAGTREQPGIIKDADDWSAIASAYQDKTISGKSFKLSDDFDNTDSPITMPLGLKTNPFNGLFDGNGRTLTLNISERYNAAPFTSIENAEIKNLAISGSLHEDGVYFGGLAAHACGDNTIEGCRVEAEITSRLFYSSEGGGFIGSIDNGTTVIRESVFAGSIYGGDVMKCGGFVGRIDGGNGARLVLDNVLFAPESAEFALNGSSTFVCTANENDLVSYSKAYYVDEFGQKQGVHVYATVPENGIYVPVTAADGGTYYLVLIVEGVDRAYNYSGEAISPVPCVSDEEGTVYQEGTDYTVTVEPGEIREIGKYTMTFTGIGRCEGEYYLIFYVREGSMPYLDTDGTEKYTSNYEYIDDGAMDLWENDLWYFPMEDITLDSRITVSGNVNLVLSDGVTLNIPKGISVTGNNSLTIWWQAGKTGALVINDVSARFAGVGGDSTSSGLITINGGDITATGGHEAAGIGGGSGGNGSIVINGGRVNATGGTVAAGIGSGSNGAADVTITGGYVHAVGDRCGAGIGGGNAGTAGIVISGGEIDAYGGMNAPGIGNGYDAKQVGAVEISGGKITSTGGERGAGIGGALQGNASVTISGGEITAAGGLNAAGIGTAINSGDAEVLISGGVITATGGDASAGIGGGHSCFATVTILGGDITARGKNGAPGIGGGSFANGEVTIYRGNVTAYGGSYAPGIGGGWHYGGNVKILGGTVTAVAGSNAPAVGGDLHANVQTTLSWSKAGDSITTVGSGNGGFSGNVTLEKAFTDGTDVYEAGVVADNSVLADKTLVPYAENGEVEDEGPAIVKHSLALGGKIGVNFLLKLPEREGIDYSGSYMEFSVSGKDGGTFTVPYDEAFMNGSGELHGFTCPVNAIQMADEIEAVFHYKWLGCDMTEEETYSVEQYVNAYVANVERLRSRGAAPDTGIPAGNLEELERMLPLVEGLADFGHYAQIYLAGQNGWKLGTDHAAMETFFAEGYSSGDVAEMCGKLDGADATKNLNTEDVAKLTCSLRLDSGTAICLYVTRAKSYKGSVTATVDGAAAAAKKQKDGRYKVEIDDIGAHLLGRTYDVVIKTRAGSDPSTVSLSALSYVKACLDKAKEGSATQEMTNAMAALYRYYEAAAAIEG